MKQALREAARGLGHTSPNPAVGAVIVRAGRVLARGYHRRAGEPHAEIEALRALRSPGLAKGATLYVTLEPCSTAGRTPPCTDAIRAAGLRRMVVGAIDPNPRHAGRGLEVLREAGLTVKAGVLATECEALNRPFAKWITTGLPWVIAKAGLSLDGRLSPPAGEGPWLTGPRARADAHRLRARVDAILIGAGTLRADDPRLTVRGVAGARQPWRIVLAGPRSRLPKAPRLFNDEHRDRTLVFRGCTLPQALRELGRRSVTSVLIEGGGDVLGQAFDRRLVDEVCFYLAPLVCGGPVVIGGRGVGASAESPELREVCYQKLGPDLKLSALIASPT